MPSLNNTIRDERATIIANHGANGGSLHVYDASDVEIYSWTWTGPIFVTPISNATLNFSSPDQTTVSVIANGTPTYAVLKDNTGTVIISGLSVGSTGTAITLDLTTLDSTMLVNWVSGMFVEGNA